MDQLQNRDKRYLALSKEHRSLQSQIKIYYHKLVQSQELVDRFSKELNLIRSVRASSNFYETQHIVSKSKKRLDLIYQSDTQKRHVTPPPRQRRDQWDIRDDNSEMGRQAQTTAVSLSQYSKGSPEKPLYKIQERKLFGKQSDSIQVLNSELVDLKNAKKNLETQLFNLEQGRVSLTDREISRGFISQKPILRKNELLSEVDLMKLRIERVELQLQRKQQRGQTEYKQKQQNL